MKHSWGIKGRIHMRTRHVLVAVALLGSFAAASLLFAADHSQIPSTSDKALVTDGHVVHNVGSLQNHVTNWGLIGSRPGMSTPFSSAPSARWGGIDYLWSAGAWFGGIVLGEPRVTTGQFASEFMSSQAPGDTIYATAQGAPGGTRYPWPGADDDGDGAEDEDPLDGLDNDSDGLVDEDFAAASDQNFRCAMADYYQDIVDIYPDHTPLDLDIVQQSFQWANPLGADFIGYEYRVTNVGVNDIDGFHCGIFADFDIGQANDDMAGSWGTNPAGYVRDPWGRWVPVTIGWMRDGATSGAAPGWVGFVLCGVETDAAAGPPANPFVMNSYQIFSGNSSFEQGGDPTNDAERYQAMQDTRWDPDTLPGRENDYRTLMSTEAVATLAPGETVVFRLALIIGDSFDDLLTNAATAVSTAIGEYFERDGDPSNFEEFNVPWLMHDEVPVPAVSGRVQARLVTGAVFLDFEVRHSDQGQIQIRRQSTAGVPARAWLLAPGSGSITDNDAVGWPRTYDLMLKSGGDPGLVLDTVEVPGPATMPLSLEAVPNPFNPRLTVSFSLPASGSARMEVVDLQGRIVRVLFDDYRSAGSDQVLWNGLDDQGRAAASGVYLVRLISGKGTTGQQVTLLR